MSIPRKFTPEAPEPLNLSPSVPAQRSHKTSIFHSPTQSPPLTCSSLHAASSSINAAAKVPGPLTSSLLAALSDPSNRKSTTVHLTGLLARVSASAAARNAFLNSRAALTRQRVRMIRFEGHVQLYISDLATVVFTGIKHTADWFLASFKENDATSCRSLFCKGSQWHLILCLLERFY